MEQNRNRGSGDVWEQKEGHYWILENHGVSNEIEIKQVESRQGMRDSEHDQQDTFKRGGLWASVWGVLLEEWP